MNLSFKNQNVKILIADDEAAARYGMRRALEKGSYEIREAENGLAALELIESFDPDVVLCDINMPELNGLELLKRIGERAAPDVHKPLVIVITAYGSEKIAVEAMKAGAYDYLTKPYEIDELRLTIDKAIEKRRLELENIRLRRQLDELSPGELIGKSDAIRRVQSIIEKVAPTDVTVLLTGESGTGKELVAKTIHSRSPRIGGPFVTMNCAAIPRDLVESELFGHEKGAFTGAVSQRQGKFEMADGGTLFLDEIADMSLETQAKILRVLEDKSFTRLGGKELIHADVRLISATNKDLAREIEAGTFRQDLYFRLKVVEIRLPRLAERKEDIPLLVNHFLRRFAAKHNRHLVGVDSQAMRALQQYDWPGNVRQLMHVIEQGVVLCDGDQIRPEHLPPEITAAPASLAFDFSPQGFSFKEEKARAVRAIEKEIIEKALTFSGGNVSQAARMLKMKRQFLQQKMSSLGISSQKFKNQKSR